MADSIAAEPQDALPMLTPSPLKMRLYVMMFLQYFVQGCYLPIISVYLKDSLGFSPTQIGLFGSALAVGPLVAPFLIGPLVDRKFATEKVLSVCHVAGGVIMLLLYWIDDIVSSEQAVFNSILVLGTLYSTLYVPSMMLTNSLSFHHLKDRDREFPLIRLWGTIGFIVPAWLVELVFLQGLEGQALNDRRGIVLLLAGIAGVLMGAYSLTLPQTPPSASDKKDMAIGKVFSLFRYRNFISLIAVSLLIAVVHKFFFVWNGPFLTAVLRQGGELGAWEGRISSIGQVFEVVVMAVLGFSIKRYGFKTTMIVGATAYMARCIIFAGAISLGGPFPFVMTLVCLGQALHGMCFGCFLAAAFIYVDRVAPADVRGSMQNFYGTFVLGVGFFLGGLFGGNFGDVFATPAGTETKRAEWGITATAGLEESEAKEGEVPKIYDWPGIWLTSAGIAGLALAGFALTFPKETPNDDAEPEAAPS